MKKNKPIIQGDDIESRDVVLILITLVANAMLHERKCKYNY